MPTAESPKRTRVRPARRNERNSPLQQDVYPEERRNYARFFADLGLRGKDLRDAVVLASLLSIIVAGYQGKL